MIGHKKRAIIYIAWGRVHIKEAIVSAQTARIAGVDRLLITNPASRAFLEPGAPFERVIDHEFKLTGLFAKSEMYHLLPAEYDSFLFLDTDTRVLLDVSLGFAKAEAHGIAASQAAAYALEHFWGFHQVLDEMKFESKEILMYNTGVIFFARSPEVWSVLQKWHELCASAIEQSYTDQPYFTLAMELLGFNPYTLSIAYNYRNFGELASGRIRIWHSHMPPPADLNEFDEPWPPRRFLQGNRLQDEFQPELNQPS